MRDLLKDLGELLRDARVRPVVHERYTGYAVRRDSWGTPRWDRAGRWFVFHSVQMGEIRAEWRGRTIVVTPGQAVLFGPEATPRVRWSEHVEVWDMHFALDGVEAAPRSFADIVVTPAPPEAAGLIDHIHVEKNEPGAAFSLLRARMALLTELMEDAARRARLDERRLTPRQRIHLFRWTQEHLADPPTPEGLAAVAGLSSDYFARLFKATFELSPREWLVRERVLAARRMIDEGGSAPAEAMRLTGFGNAAHFARLMKRLTGRTPGGRAGWRRGGAGGRG